MKAIVENIVGVHETEFIGILKCIILAENEGELRRNMKTLIDIKNYMYGFGASHMWVSHSNLSRERLIIVEF